MKKAPSLIILLALVFGAEAQAAPTAPVLLVERTSAHCQAPRWAPDGSKLAVDVFNPKKDIRSTWIISFGAGGQKLNETEVKTGRSSASALLGEAAPIVELTWAPDMKL